MPTANEADNSANPQYRALQIGQALDESVESDNYNQAERSKPAPKQRDRAKLQRGDEDQELLMWM